MAATGSYAEVDKERTMHDRDEHYAKCGYCGWIGFESELPDDFNHECGKDQCPECKKENFISCCFESYEEAEEYFPQE